MKPNSIVMVYDRLNGIGWRMAKLVRRRSYLDMHSSAAQGWEVKFITGTPERKPQGGFFSVDSIKKRVNLATATKVPLKVLLKTPDYLG